MYSRHQAENCYQRASDSVHYLPPNHMGIRRKVPERAERFNCIACLPRLSQEFMSNLLLPDLRHILPYSQKSKRRVD